jgi:hypothetical protein
LDIATLEKFPDKGSLLIEVAHDADQGSHI